MKNNKEVSRLKKEIQQEIQRLQMLDYISEHSYVTLEQMRKELKEVKQKGIDELSSEESTTGTIAISNSCGGHGNTLTLGSNI
jgi:hypothetical protein